MVQKEIAIADFHNAYSNPFAELVQLACHYDSEIHLNCNNQHVNAKSIMGIMAFQASENSTVVIQADGPDEAEAVLAIENYLLCKKS